MAKERARKLNTHYVTTKVKGRKIKKRSRPASSIPKFRSKTARDSLFTSVSNDPIARYRSMFQDQASADAKEYGMGVNFNQAVYLPNSQKNFVNSLIKGKKFHQDYQEQRERLITLAKSSSGGVSSVVGGGGSVANPSPVRKRLAFLKSHGSSTKAMFGGKFKNTPALETSSIIPTSAPHSTVNPVPKTAGGVGERGGSEGGGGKMFRPTQRPLTEEIAQASVSIRPKTEEEKELWRRRKGEDEQRKKEREEERRRKGEERRAKRKKAKEEREEKEKERAQRRDTINKLKARRLEREGKGALGDLKPNALAGVR